jgi:hypothetical protein
METEKGPGVSEYNYRHFRSEEYALDRFPGPDVGDAAADVSLVTVDGRRVSLSDFRGRTVVLETGSWTCPQYVARIDGMNELAARHPDIEFVLLYVREAHPGTQAREHSALADKLALADRTVAEEPELRTVLVDDIEGSAHRAYGSLPNMVYVIDPAGTVVFRGAWNNVGVLTQVLDRLAGGRAPTGLRMAFRPVAPGVLLRVLRRAGWDAVLDFVRALPRLAATHLRVARTGYRS